jgi:protein TonB
MLDLQKKPRWFIAVVIGIHALALYGLISQVMQVRMGSPNSAMEVSSFEIAPPAAAPSAMPNPAMLIPSLLRARDIALPGFNIGLPTRHAELAPRTGNDARHMALPAGAGQQMTDSDARGDRPSTGASSGQGDAIPTLPSGQVRYLVPPRAIYPPGSANANEAGTARVRIEFDENGRSAGVTLLSSTGFPRLDQAAIEGAQDCILAPIAGMKARVFVNQEIIFRVY